MKSTKVVTLDCGNLRIEWQRVEDRWQHVIGVKFGNQFCAFLSSIEGVADDLWPTSPTFQEMHVEQRGENSVVLLTGMAGKSYWSASVLCDPKLHRATVEIACRSKETPNWLGSLYQTPEWLEVRHSQQSIAMSLPHDACRMLAETSDLIGSVPQLSRRYDDVSKSPWYASFIDRIKGYRRTIFFAPPNRADGDLRTVQWAYSLSLSPTAATTPQEQTP